MPPRATYLCAELEEKCGSYLRYHAGRRRSVFVVEEMETGLEHIARTLSPVGWDLHHLELRRAVHERAHLLSVHYRQPHELTFAFEVSDLLLEDY